MDVFGSFGVNDRNGDTAEKSERYEALFSVVEPIIFEREGRALEYPWRIDKVEAMRLQVCPTFPFVPRETHRQSVYTVAR